ncbi:hypothetical protein Pint_23876 [Pistacia integerrima]|uniref:Uncharacterized protein n=1 Tax=Pistacia integerrima TaxID=434235 RepID=A0ACC0YK27_9ROSI|nr:hypothetical protein Pint_23876 [Pistacia integerrima]
MIDSLSLYITAPSPNYQLPPMALAVPASVLTLGGGYLFGLPVDFLADSVGAAAAAGATFLLGRTLPLQFQGSIPVPPA